MNEFPISYTFAEKYVRFSNPEYLQLYLYISYQVHKAGVFPKTEQIAKDLDITPDRAIFILDFWVSRDELIYDEGGYRFPDCKEAPKPTPAPQRAIAAPKDGRKQASRPSYTITEIDAVAANNKSISGLFYQAETVLHKMLTPSDMEMLYSFVDWLGLPVEVITMLLSYAAKRGKTNRRYLETVAIDWAERGIDTFEAAESHVMVLEAADSMERQIRSILGIYDRALTSTERKYIKLWTEDGRITPELVSLAYDRTVTHTGKLSWAYMNKILESWAQDELTTPEAVEAMDANPGRKPAPKNDKTLPKKSPINNYQDGNTTDYSQLEEQLLDMMLDQEV